MTQREEKIVHPVHGCYFLLSIESSDHATVGRDLFGASLISNIYYILVYDGDRLYK